MYGILLSLPLTIYNASINSCWQQHKTQQVNQPFAVNRGAKKKVKERNRKREEQAKIKRTCISLPAITIMHICTHEYLFWESIITMIFYLKNCGN